MESENSEHGRPETHLGLVPALLVDAVLRLLALFCVLHARRDGADLDLLQRRGEVCVERERVAGAHFAPWRMLLQDFVLCARERLQLALELDVRDRR